MIKSQKEELEERNEEVLKMEIQEQKVSFDKYIEEVKLQVSSNKNTD